MRPYLFSGSAPVSAQEKTGKHNEYRNKKNLEDWNLAYEQVQAFVESHIPEVFSETHLKKVRQAQLYGLLIFYVKGDMGTREIRAALAGVELKDYSFRFRAALRIIQFCPGLLRILYPVYRPFRMLAGKVFGR